jgi:tetratricopeptide (TPR) repeat protein
MNRQRGERAVMAIGENPMRDLTSKFFRAAISRVLGGCAIGVMCCTAAIASTLGACSQTTDLNLAIRACTINIQTPTMPETDRREALLLRAKAYSLKGDYISAIADYDTLIRTESDQAIKAKLYFLRAHAYEALGQWDKAIADYSALIQLDGEDADAFFLRGQASEAKGNLQATLKAAKDDYEEAVSLTHYKEAEYLIAEARVEYLYYQAVIDEVLRNNERTIHLQPMISMVNIDAAIALAPNNPEAYLVSGNLARLDPDLPRAESDFSKAISLKPDYADAYFARAIVRAAKRNFDAAIVDLDSAIRLDSENAVFYTLRGVIQGVKGSADRQIADYSKSIALNPLDPQRHLMRDWAFFKAGKQEPALRDVNHALLLAPELAAAHATRGFIHEALWQKKEAVADFTKALSLSADMREAKDGLKRLDTATVISTSPTYVPEAVAGCEYNGLFMSRQPQLNVGILVADTAADIENGRELMRRLAKQGALRIVLTEVYPAFAAGDFTPGISKLKTSGIDILYHCAGDRDQQLMLRQLKESGMTVRR